MVMFKHVFTRATVNQGKGPLAKKAAAYFLEFYSLQSIEFYQGYGDAETITPRPGVAVYIQKNESGRGKADRFLINEVDVLAANKISMYFGKFSDIARTCDLQRFQAFLDELDDIHIHNSNGEVFLHLLTKFDTATTSVMAHALIDRGVDINAVNRSKETPLHLAISEGSLPLAFTLVERGADFNCKNQHGYSAVALAGFWGHTDLLKLFAYQTIEPEIRKSVLDRFYPPARDLWRVLMERRRLNVLSAQEPYQDDSFVSSPTL